MSDTPLDYPPPWDFDSLGMFYPDSDAGMFITEMVQATGWEEYAKFIRKAVNCHDELVAALEVVLPMADLAADYLPADGAEEIAKARALLAKVKGG